MVKRLLIAIALFCAAAFSRAASVSFVGPYTMNGTSDYQTVAAANNYGSFDGSIQVWFKLAAVPNETKVLFYQYGAFAVDISSAGVVSMSFYDINAATHSLNYQLPEGAYGANWHYIVLNYSNVLLSLYYDGILQTTSAVSFQLGYNAYQTNAVAGAYFPFWNLYPSNYFAGVLKDMLYSSTPVTSTIVEEQWLAGGGNGGGEGGGGGGGWEGPDAQFWSDLQTAVEDSLASVIDAIGTAAIFIGTAIGDASSACVDAVGQLYDWFSVTLGAWLVWWEEAWADFVVWMSEFKDDLIEHIDGVATAVTHDATEAVAAVGSTVSSVADDVNTFVTYTYSTVTTTAAQKMDELKGAVVDVGAKIIGFREWFDRVWTAFIGWCIDVWDFLTNANREGGSLPGYFKGIWESITGVFSWLGDTKDWLVKCVGNIFSLQHIGDWFESVVNYLFVPSSRVYASYTEQLAQIGSIWSVLLHPFDFMQNLSTGGNRSLFEIESPIGGYSVNILDALGESRVRDVRMWASWLIVFAVFGMFVGIWRQKVVREL